MTKLANKKTATPIMSVREALTIADGASATAANAHMAFDQALLRLVDLGVTVAALSGKKGEQAEGVHYATAKDSIAKRVFTAKQYGTYTNTTLSLKVAGKDTERGAMHKKVNSRLANLRGALERITAIKAKGAGAVKLNAQEAGLKAALDKAAAVKKSFGDQKTEAAQAAKAAWVDVHAVHAAWVTLHDTLIAIHGKHGGGK